MPPSANPPGTDHSRWFMTEVHPHEPALRSYLRRRFPWLSDVDDLVQDSFVRLWRMTAAGRPGTGKGLLFTTARHLAIDLLRRRQAARVDAVADFDSLALVAQVPGVAEIVCRNQELQILADAIALLPNRCRQVLTLRKIYGYSQKEIGVRLQISENTVEVQITRGMRRCVEYLRRRGVAKG